MKIRFIVMTLALMLGATGLRAQLTVTYADGSDGVLKVTGGTNLIDLASAVTGVWTNTSSSAGNAVPGSGG